MPAALAFCRAEAAMALRRILIGSDIHVPYHDPDVVKLFLKVASQWAPDIVVLNGDIADFYAVSDHSKDPRRAKFLEDELDVLRAFLGDLASKTSKARRIYLEGNHENRLERYLMSKAPELFRTCQFNKLMDLPALGYEHVKYRDYIKIGKVYFTHDIGKAGKYAHYDAQAAFEGNVVIGHTHFCGYQISGSLRGKPHVGVSFGHMSDLAKVDYKHRAKALRDWTHGFGVGYLDTTTGNAFLVPTPVVDKSVLIDGKLVKL